MSTIGIQLYEAIEFIVEIKELWRLEYVWSDLLLL